MSELLNKTDIRILNSLQNNCKITSKALAEKLELTTTPIFKQINRLEMDGIIDKYVALLNQKKIDKKLSVFVSILLKNHTRSYLQKYVDEINGYNEVQKYFHIAGDFDFMLKVVVKDMKTYESFILSKLSIISNIAHVKSSFVLLKNKYSTAYKFKKSICY